MTISARRNHRWSDPVTMPTETPSGCQETHRSCVLCSLIKVTVHPPHGDAYRLWQYPDGGRADGLTPTCGDVAEVKFQ